MHSQWYQPIGNTGSQVFIFLKHFSEPGYMVSFNTLKFFFLPQNSNCNFENTNALLFKCFKVLTFFLFISYRKFLHAELEIFYCCKAISWGADYGCSLMNMCLLITLHSNDNVSGSKLGNSSVLPPDE